MALPLNSPAETTQVGLVKLVPSGLSTITAPNSDTGRRRNRIRAGQTNELAQKIIPASDRRTPPSDHSARPLI